MIAIGWKIVFPSPRNAFVSPVPRMTDGMIAKPRPRRVAFRKRSLGWIWMSPRPWLANVHSWVPLFGMLRPATMPIGTITPSSPPRCGRFMKPTAPCSDGRTSVSTENEFACPMTPVPVNCSGRRAYDMTSPKETSHWPSTADELTVTNPFESIAGRKISRSTGAF